MERKEKENTLNHFLNEHQVLNFLCFQYLMEICENNVLCIQNVFN